MNPLDSTQRRAHPRVKVKWPVTMMTPEGDMDGIIENISAGGPLLDAVRCYRKKISSSCPFNHKTERIHGQGPKWYGQMCTSLVTQGEPLGWGFASLPSLQRILDILMLRSRSTGNFHPKMATISASGESICHALAASTYEITVPCQPVFIRKPPMDIRKFPDGKQLLIQLNDEYRKLGKSEHRPQLQPDRHPRYYPVGLRGIFKLRFY